MNSQADLLQSSQPAPTAQHARRTTVIAVAAGQRGAGKTSLAVNLAVTLAQNGNRVCLLDPDTRHDGATQLLGGRTDISLDAFLADRIGLDKVRQEGVSNISLISAPNALNARNPGQISIMRAALQRLEEKQDYLIINAPGGTEPHALEIIRSTQYVLVSLLPDLESIKSSYSLVWSLVRQGFAGAVHVVVNKVGDRAEALSSYRHFKKITERRLGVQVRSMGYVVRDNRLHDAFYQQVPVTLRYPEARSTRCFRGIVEILQQRFVPETYDKGFGEKWHDGGAAATTAHSTVVRLPPRLEENLTVDERFDRLFEHFTAFIDEEQVSQERLRQAISSLEEHCEAKYGPPSTSTYTGRLETRSANLIIERTMEQLQPLRQTPQPARPPADIEGLYQALESAARLAAYENQRFISAW